MNKRQKLVQDAFLKDEEKIISRLKKVYAKSLDDITKKSKELQDQINTLDALQQLTDDEEEKALLKSMEQAKIYQKQYQDALKKQIGSILDNMQVEEFKTVDEYLRQCYEDGFIGTMYDLHGQGIPLCMPLDQEAMVRAVQTDSKISQGLYTRLGEDVALLKKKITAQVSRSISTGMTYAQMAQQLAAYTNIGFNNAVRIARTEGHRIQVQSTMDACYKAKDKGADVVKQWDATLDRRTRRSHTKVDGEIRELDEPFSNGLMFPGDPAGGAKEVVNCRCALLQRAKWALDEDELATLKERAAYFGLDKTGSFEDFKVIYLKAVEKIFEIPAINDTITAKNLENFIDALNESEGEENHVIKMRMHAEFVDYEENPKLSVPFAYNVTKDVIEYNPNAPHFDKYDMNFVQAHELSHRMDILEYDSVTYRDFEAAIDTCKQRVLENAEEVQRWFVEGGKYEQNAALSDIISALCDGNIEVPYGHSEEYWTIKENVIREIFANISAIDVLDSKTKADVKFLLNELFESYGGIVG